MTLADELQRDAELAKHEGGIYYSGQYLQGYADRVRKMEEDMAEDIDTITRLRDCIDDDKENARLYMGENKELRELVKSFYDSMRCMCDTGVWPVDPRWYAERMREFGIEEGE